MQHLCRCCNQSVHVSARLYVLRFSLCYNIAERAKTLFQLLWGQLRNRTRRETGAWRKPTPPSKMSTRLLTLLPMINSKGKCPTDIKDLTKPWLKSGRIFQSLGWTPFHRRLMFCKGLVRYFPFAARSSCHCFL